MDARDEEDKRERERERDRDSKQERKYSIFESFSIGDYFQGGTIQEKDFTGDRLYFKSFFGFFFFF